MADAVGAVDEGVVDELEVGRLAGVDRHVEVALPGERQGLGVQRRRDTRSRRPPGRTPRPSRHGRGMRSTSRAISSERSAVRMAQQIRLAVIRPPRVGLAPPQPGGHRLDGFLRLERRVQLRGEADLGVDDPVGGEVGDGLGGDPFEGSRRLQHGERVLERRQVLQEVAGVGAAREPRLQLVAVRRRQLPPALVGELDHRRRPQPAVEVVVQQRLRRRDAAPTDRRAVRSACPCATGCRPAPAGAGPGRAPRP